MPDEFQRVPLLRHLGGWGSARAAMTWIENTLNDSGNSLPESHRRLSP